MVDDAVVKQTVSLTGGMCPVYDRDEIRIRSYPQTYHTRNEISLDLHLSESEEENESQ